MSAPASLDVSAEAIDALLDSPGIKSHACVFWLFKAREYLGEARANPSKAEDWTRKAEGCITNLALEDADLAERARNVPR